MSKKIIFLCGLSGTGKSHWARRLSQEYALLRIDIDEKIEHQQGKPVAQLFSEQGEEAFRVIERDALIGIINETKEPAVIACGGGTPCFFDNMQLMNYSGYVVYLKAAPETILERLRNSYRRPLLLQPNPEEKLHEMLRERSHFYEQAQYIFHSETVSLATFAEIVKQCINPH